MEYTKEQLLNVLESYKRMIENDNNEYPDVVLNDIYSSIKYVLKQNKTPNGYKNC